MAARPLPRHAASAVSLSVGVVVAIRRIYRNLRRDFRDYALSRGLIPSTRDYARFVILGMGRSGSNLLASSLRSHESIVAFGEIFNNAKMDHILWEYPGYESTPRQIARRARDATGFIETVVFKPMPRQTRAVGFKLFYYHARDGGWRDIWPYLQAMDLKVIHLKRKNLLALQLSMTLALKTNEWSTRQEGVKQDKRKCALPYESCLKGFEAVTQWQEEADQFFTGKDKLEVWYEDLNANYEATINTVQRFLKVEIQPARSPLKKQSGLPLSETILNYQELKERFAGSRWECFFD
jgi:LPS sulfotransferase NodH